MASDQKYIGHTQDIQARLDIHNAGGSIYTAQYKPWELVTYLCFKEKNQATAF